MTNNLIKSTQLDLVGIYLSRSLSAHYTDSSVAYAVNGEQGIQGATGPYYIGATGVSGDDGFIGATGYDGATGPEGYKGATGPSPSVQGQQGLQGDDGATGIKGVTGKVGATGINNTNDPLDKLENELWQVIIGKVDYWNNIFSGPGYTASRTNNGEYTIYFNQNYVNMPTIVATPIANFNYNVCVVDISTSLAIVRGFNTVGTPSDIGFSFMVVGPA
jgi:hypothetical protein